MQGPSLWRRRMVWGRWSCGAPMEVWLQFDSLLVDLFPILLAMPLFAIKKNSFLLISLHHNLILILVTYVVNNFFSYFIYFFETARQRLVGYAASLSFWGYRVITHQLDELRKSSNFFYKTIHYYTNNTFNLFSLFLFIYKFSRLGYDVWSSKISNASVYSPTSIIETWRKTEPDWT